MTHHEISQNLTEVFRDIFDDTSLVIRDDMTAQEVAKWDSISHIDMICLVEDKFKIQLTTKDDRTSVM